MLVLQINSIQNATQVYRYAIKAHVTFFITKYL